jgi:hypothetical protein
MPAWCILLKVDVDQRRLTPMDRRNPETVGVRRTGWAALDRDPQQDTVEFICPHCGARDKKNARRERALYRFTDGFLQDIAHLGAHGCSAPIGIGGAVARSPLPHHPTCGSASGGSEGYAGSSNKEGSPSESK